MRLKKIVEAFSKCDSITGRIVAAKAPHIEHKSNSMIAQGEIKWRATVGSLPLAC
jgi:hypothetical protein